MPSLRRRKQIVAAGLFLALLWSYWPVLGQIVERWTIDPKYSHGYLVPIFAGWLLWRRLRRAGPDAVTAEKEKAAPAKKADAPSEAATAEQEKKAAPAKKSEAVTTDKTAKPKKADAITTAPKEEKVALKLGAPANGAGSWWGLAILVPGLALHLAGAYIYLDFLSEASLLVCLAGLCLCLGGKTLLSAAAPAIGFLVFMLPLPFRVEVALGQPLQRIATQASTYLLQMLGFYAADQGNIIVLRTARPLGVVEACSGLGMLVTFFALAVAVAIVLHRPMLDRVIVVASAIPVAVIANVLRIVITGVLAETVGGEVVYWVYHSVAGWLMMSIALGIIFIELKILSRLLVEPPPAALADIALNLGQAVRPAAARRKPKVSSRR
jgi:exosortase